MLAKVLSDQLKLNVVEQLVTGPEIYNHEVTIMSADFNVLYTVDNIRKLGKEGFKEDKHRTPIVNVVKTVYKQLFDMQFENDEKEEKMSFTLDDFGDDDMFMSNMPTPVKKKVAVESPSPDSVVTPPEIAAPAAATKQLIPEPVVEDAGGFVFSMDEDF